MWLATRYGFFSVVCTTDNGKTNTDMFVVRARQKGHLMALRKGFPALAGCTMLTTPRSDYPCRLLVPRCTWADVMLALVADIDYTNFKDEVKRTRPKDDGYLAFCMSTWCAGTRMSPTPPYGGSTFYRQPL